MLQSMTPVSTKSRKINGKNLLGSGFAQPIKRPSSPVAAFDVLDVLSTGIALINPASFVQLVESYFTNRPAASGAYVVFRDVHGVVRALDDPQLRAAHERAFLVAPDGLPLAWLAKLRGHRNAARVCGPDTLPMMCQAGLAKGRRHVFVGGTPATLEALAARLTEQYPGLIIADLISPPFKPPSQEETAMLVARIRHARPDFVWVGLGSPKQDLWMLENAQKIPGALCMGVGAAFDMSAGRIKRAPIWVQRVGMEWAYRILQEPKRLWRRYATTIPRFVLLVLAEAVSERIRRLPRFPASGSRDVRT